MMNMSDPRGAYELYKLETKVRLIKAELAARQQAK